MTKVRYTAEQLHIAKQLFRWIFLITPVAVTIGLLVAFFLWLLDVATNTRWDNEWLIWLLPVCGLLITWLYHYFGKNSDAGTNLILDEIHEPGAGIPARMTPIILMTTVMTHLTGGSAGREGTALQMGGAISALFSKWFKLNREHRRMLLLCGISAGFGAVFGTPVAGAVFALEVLSVGRIRHEALLPCLFAGIIADVTCTATGITHTQYHVSFLKGAPGLPYLHIDGLLLLKVIVAGILFGLAGYLFASACHLIKKTSNKYIANKYLIPVVGAALIIGISYALGSFDFLGLGVEQAGGGGVSIVSAFSAGSTGYLSWFWKLLLTAITVSMGFKGGEVTPLFFIGATLGNTLAIITDAPIDLFAALGFIAVFAGATNTPLACTFMGVELFGSEHILYYAVACFVAYYFSGHAGIYKSQRVTVPKFNYGKPVANKQNRQQ